MHELSIAMGIVKIAEQELAKSQSKSISKIEIEIGELAGIEFESLDFVWPMAVQDSALEKAEMVIVKTKGKAQCMECDTIFELIHLFDDCPQCKGYLKNVIQGKELRVLALEVE